MPEQLDEFQEWLISQGVTATEEEMVEALRGATPAQPTLPAETLNRFTETMNRMTSVAGRLDHADVREAIVQMSRLQADHLGVMTSLAARIDPPEIREAIVQMSRLQSDQARMLQQLSQAPPPQVKVEPPDLRPLLDAVKRNGDDIRQNGKSMEALAQAILALAKAVREAKPPKVEVTAPVEIKMPEPKPRKLTMKRSDGTSCTLSEE